MEEIRILWLFDDLLDLYGDSGNIRILEYYLKKNGIPYSIIRKGLYDDTDLSGYDFIYCGPGKLKNLLKAAEKMHGLQKEVREAIESGTLMLFTGSSMLLLGKEIRDKDGNTIACSSVFDYSGEDLDKVMIEDVVTSHPYTESRIYGFINRTARLMDETEEQKKNGFHKNNLWATWLLGPLFVKNPELLSWYYEKLTGQKLNLNDSLEMQAYRKTMEEF